jgi:phosphate transport system protein
LDNELYSLKEKILAMGGHVEKAIEESTQAIIRREPNRFQLVKDYEKKINLYHIEIDEDCLELIARKAPLAADLRFILAVIKINTDLERMGDQCMNISFNGDDYLKRSPHKMSQDLPEMAREVREMVKSSLDAFVRQDIAMAEKVLKRDDIVDSFKNKMFQDLTAEMRASPIVIEACLNMILIARNLERLADHATNIAEDVIFVSTGRDVRHGPRTGP